MKVQVSTSCFDDSDLPRKTADGNIAVQVGAPYYLEGGGTSPRRSQGEGKAIRRKDVLRAFEGDDEAALYRWSEGLRAEGIVSEFAKLVASMRDTLFS